MLFFLFYIFKGFIFLVEFASVHPDLLSNSYHLLNMDLLSGLHGPGTLFSPGYEEMNQSLRSESFLLSWEDSALFI